MKKNKQVKKEDKWVFCNTKFQPYPYEYSSTQKCPKCGGHLMNVLGLCAKKNYLDNNPTEK
jgi:Zn finger protein HypA/HybF involved in hydrogenase expression